MAVRRAMLHVDSLTVAGLGTFNQLPASTGDTSRSPQKIIDPDPELRTCPSSISYLLANSSSGSAPCPLFPHLFMGISLDHVHY